MFAKINNNLNNINNIKSEFVINQTQFNKISKQYNKKFIKFDKLFINKDFIEDSNINNQHYFDIAIIKKQINLI